MTVDITPEAVEQLAQSQDEINYPLCSKTAATLRALSARLAELDAGRDAYRSMHAQAEADLKKAIAALATARADHMREAADKAVIAAAIYDPGSTQGYKGDRTLTEWQADAVVHTILALIPPTGEAP
jgi:hypothetical protein